MRNPGNQSLLIGFRGYFCCVGLLLSNGLYLHNSYCMTLSSSSLSTTLCYDCTVMSDSLSELSRHSSGLMALAGSHHIFCISNQN